VLYEGARSREVYLPGGTTVRLSAHGEAWTNAWTDETFDGGH